MSTPADQLPLQAVDTGVSAANAAARPEDTPPVELEEVKRLNDEYREARAFDEDARKQYNKDRRYAQGVQDLSWASDANIIGTHIDILTAFLYAKNPDVSCRPSPQAGMLNLDPVAAQAFQLKQNQRQNFAETLQIVISRLWKDAKLKRTMRRDVRSALSVGPGWMKALMYDQKKRNPQVEKQISDTRDNLEQIQAIQTKLREDEMDATEADQKVVELQRLMAGLEANVEILIKRGLCADFVRAEDIQISLDVAETVDYLDADWISNDMYVRIDQLRARFPVFTEEDIKTATVYFQKKPQLIDVNRDQDATPSADGAYTTSEAGVMTAGGKAIQFGKIVELWNHRNNLIYTFVDGVKRWAVPPYPPPQATTRFYPYFRLAFFEVDGARHPQSLSWRERKLQDEYSATRSAGLITKQRSIPGIVFNKGELSEEDAGRIQASTHQEWVGVQTTTPDADLKKIVAEKPVSRADPAIFDTSACERDMGSISGVQDPARNVQTGVTATEISVQQSATESRTDSDRDELEELLNDLAVYTAELAIQSLDAQQVARMAGDLSFWPEGMDPQDILSLLDVEIKAGTTGKPDNRADKEAWATLLPLIQQMMAQIQQFEITNPPLAAGYKNLLRITLRRLDDTITLETIMPPALPMPAMPAPGAAAPGGPPGAGGDMPAVGNGAVNNPVAQGGAAPVDIPASPGTALA